MLEPSEPGSQHVPPHRAQALSLGIDERYISDLMDGFYARVRAHEVLGPFFINAIGEDWSRHLPIIKQFWVTYVFGTAGYSRDMGGIHKRLDHLRPEHFSMWLNLFRATLVDTASSPEVVDFFMKKAEIVAYSLQVITFGRENVQAMGIRKPSRKR